MHVCCVFLIKIYCNLYTNRLPRPRIDFFSLHTARYKYLIDWLIDWLYCIVLYCIYEQSPVVADDEYEATSDSIEMFLAGSIRQCGHDKAGQWQKWGLTIRAPAIMLGEHARAHVLHNRRRHSTRARDCNSCCPGDSRSTFDGAVRSICYHTWLDHRER